MFRITNPFGRYPVCEGVGVCKRCGKNTLYAGTPCSASSIWRRWSYVSVRSIVAMILIVLAILAVMIALHNLSLSPSMSLMEGVDYKFFFEPASRSPNPYDVFGFFNPFWALAPVWMIGVFGSYRVAAWITLNMILILWVCVKMKMPLWIVPPYFILSGAMMGTYYGNIEGLVALGLILPAPVGLIFLMIKPQVGMAIALYHALDSLLRGGWRRTVKVFLPLAVMLVASVALYGAWFLNSTTAAGFNHNTINFFPYGIPVGLALILAGVRRGNIGYALMAVPMLTPYMIFHTWMFPIMGAILVIRREVKIVKKIPAQCFHPGEFISDEINSRNWTVEELAKRMTRKKVIDPILLKELIDGKRNITPNIAFALSHAFGTSPDLWINLQSAFDDWCVFKQL